MRQIAGLTSWTATTCRLTPMRMASVMPLRAMTSTAMGFRTTAIPTTITTAWMMSTMPSHWTLANQLTRMVTESAIMPTPMMTTMDTQTRLKQIVAQTQTMLAQPQSIATAMTCATIWTRTMTAMESTMSMMNSRTMEPRVSIAMGTVLETMRTRMMTTTDSVIVRN